MYSVVSKALAFLLLLPASALAVDLVCTVPAAQVSRAVELCEELRLNLGIRTSEWSNDVCATQFLRIGLREGEKRSTERASRQTVNNNVDLALETFKSNWPLLVRASCSDGTLDTEFGEACDDGNQTNGDGCDEECQIE